MEQRLLSKPQESLLLSLNFDAPQFIINNVAADDTAHQPADLADPSEATMEIVLIEPGDPD